MIFMEFNYCKKEELVASDKFIENVIYKIIEWQKIYLKTYNKKDLRQMTLQNISDQTLIDKSVISRICNAVEIEIFGRKIDLKFLFHCAGVGGNSAFEISSIMLDLILNENPRHRYTDIALCETLNSMGYAIERRTVCKYRKVHLNLPASNKRA